MRGFKSLVPLALLLAMALVTAACDSPDAELSTTTSVLSGGSDGTDGGDSEPDGEVTSTTASDPGSETPTTLRGSNVDSYEVIAREPGDGGEILYIVIPQADYTDVDLENFVGDLILSGQVSWGAEIFDDVLALEAYRLDEAERTEEQTELIGQHHFATVATGDTLIFRGPFEASGQLIIGS